MKKQNKKNKINLSLEFFGLYFLSGIFFSLIIFGYFFYQSHRIVELEVFGEDLNFYQPIVLDFSSPMLRETVEANLEVTPKIEYSLLWEGDQRLYIKLEQYPMPGVSYNFKIAESKNRYLAKQRVFYFSLITEKDPIIASFFPANNQENVLIDQAIEIYFDKSIIDDYEIFFELTPKPDQIEYSLDKNKLTVYPLLGFKKDASYKYKVVLKNNEIIDYEKVLLEAEFFTQKTKPVIYNFDSEGKAVKIEKRIEEYEPKIKEGKLLQVDLSSQTLILYNNGQEVDLFKISSGARGMNTPIGEFKVMGKARRPWSKTYELYMPYFIQFTNQGHGFHELPEWPGGYKEGENHLGVPVSHGCVRLGVGPAKVVYDFVQIGTPIVVQE